MSGTDRRADNLLTARRNISALVRAPLWFTAKLLPLAAAAELAALMARVAGTEGVPRTLATLGSAIGVAAGAHIVNDMADRTSDRVAGKANAGDRISTPTTVTLLVSSGVAAVAPWLIVPIDPWAAVVLIMLVGASLAYSLPPIRLKGRAGFGVAADALVAHILPVAFAFLELGGAGQRTAGWWWAMAAALTWATGYGVRNIIVHEVRDEPGDRLAGIRTYVVARGVPRAVRTGRDAFAIEFIGLVALFVVTAFTAWGVALFFAGHFLLWLNHRRFEPLQIDTVPTSPGAWLPVAEFYEVWPALAYGGALTLRDPTWLWMPGTVVVLFWSAVFKQVRNELGLLRELSADLAHRYLRDVLWAGVQSGWWMGYRGYWRFRKATVDPVIVFVRRQGRRVRRKTVAHAIRASGRRDRH